MFGTKQEISLYNKAPENSGALFMILVLPVYLMTLTGLAVLPFAVLMIQ